MIVRVLLALCNDDRLLVAPLPTQRNAQRKVPIGFPRQQRNLRTHRCLGLLGLAEAQQHVAEALVAERAVGIEGEPPSKELARILEVLLAGLPRVHHHQQAVATLDQPPHVLHLICERDEGADDVAQPRVDGRARVAHGARSEGDVALSHVDGPIEVLKVGSAARKGLRWREGDRECEKGVVNVDVGARGRVSGSLGPWSR